MNSMVNQTVLIVIRHDNTSNRRSITSIRDEHVSSWHKEMFLCRDYYTLLYVLLSGLFLLIIEYD